MEVLKSASTIKGGVAVEVFLNMMDEMLKRIMESDIYTTALKALIPAGLALCIVYCCVELIDKTSHQTFNIENIILQFIRFVVVYALVSNVDTLITGFGTLVSSINTSILGYLKGIDGLNQVVANNIDGLNQVVANNNNVIVATNEIQSSTAATALSINRVFSTIFNLVIQVMIIVIGVERAVIIGAKTLIAPIIVPDVYHNGMNSTGIKFLKGLLGDFFTTTMLVFIIEMCCIVAFSTDGTNTTTQYMPMDAIKTGLVGLAVLYGGLKKARIRAQQIVMGMMD